MSVSVQSRPPTRSRASSTATLRPARRRAVAAVSPQAPAPMTTTSRSIRSMRARIRTDLGRVRCRSAAESVDTRAIRTNAGSVDRVRRRAGRRAAPAWRRRRRRRRSRGPRPTPSTCSRTSCRRGRGAARRGSRCASRSRGGPGCGPTPCGGLIWIGQIRLGTPSTVSRSPAMCVTKPSADGDGEPDGVVGGEEQRPRPRRSGRGARPSTSASRASRAFTAKQMSAIVAIAGPMGTRPSSGTTRGERGRAARRAP